MKFISSFLALSAVVVALPQPQTLTSTNLTLASVSLTPAQQAKILNAALAALAVEAAINNLINAKSSTAVVSTTPPAATTTSLSIPKALTSSTTSFTSKASTPTLSTPTPSSTPSSSSSSNSGSPPTSFSTGGTTNVLSNCLNQGQFAMTFDDGPYIYGKEITDVFAPSNSKATFFVNGNNYDCIYDKADDLIARYQAGHQIASHTWGHDDITTLSAADLNSQITLVETALWKILGIRPHHFRPPYGNYNDAAVAVLATRGYQTVIWSDDDGDSIGSTTSQSLADYEKIYPTFPAPHNMLNHETYSNVQQSIIPVVVPKLLSAGWKLVTVAECLNQPAYQTPINYGGTPGVRDSSWTCSGTPNPGAP